MKREFEGTIKLQGVGTVEGIKAKNLKVGDVTVWNFGGTETIKEIRFSKTGKTLVAVVDCNGKEYERRMTAERIVAVKELNPAEVVEEVIEAEEVEEAQTPQPQKRMSEYEKWIRTFIEEKGLDLNTEFTVEHEETIHFVSLDFLVEVILKASKEEQGKIKDTLVRLDFINGNVVHFFEHLAFAYIVNNY